jgi:hypothetical protein
MIPADAEQVRAEVRAWLDENWSPDRSRDQWRIALVESGWAAPTWPLEWFGRGLTSPMRKVPAGRRRGHWSGRHEPVRERDPRPRHR